MTAAPLAEIVTRYLPWSEPGVAWAAQETWLLHALRLWADEPAWMAELTRRMRREDGWLFGPVVVDDGYVQDGHHRLVAALGLGWHSRDLPLEPAL